jgi:replicative DNA helicase
MIDRTPRQDIDAERAVIGAVMLDQRALEDINLSGEDFYRPQHEQLWDLILSESRAGRPVTPMALVQKLITAPIPGMEAIYLHECMDAAPVRGAVPHYAGIVTGLARLRRLADVGVKLADFRLGRN